MYDTNDQNKFNNLDITFPIIESIKHKKNLLFIYLYYSGAKLDIANCRVSLDFHE